MQAECEKGKKERRRLIWFKSTFRITKSVDIRVCWFADKHTRISLSLSLFLQTNRIEARNWQHCVKKEKEEREDICGNHGRKGNKTIK